MTEWCYKATNAKVGFERTRDLAINDGFLCRSAYESNKTRADNTKAVNFGDLVHMYFVASSHVEVIGTFQVIGKMNHAHGDRFGGGVGGTKLYLVADEAFERKLLDMGGYEQDPVLKVMTGWLLQRREDLQTPSYADTPLNGRQSTLVRRS